MQENKNLKNLILWCSKSYFGAPWRAESSKDANRAKVASPASATKSSSSLQDFNEWIPTRRIESTPATTSDIPWLSMDDLLLKADCALAGVPSEWSASKLSASSLISSRKRAALGCLWMLCPSNKSLVPPYFETEFSWYGEMLEPECLFLHVFHV